MTDPVAANADTPPTAAGEPGVDHPPDANAAPPGYEILGAVGQGGMGVVCAARDTVLGRDVALKLLLPRFAGVPAAGQRFVYEARVTARLQHPGIPPVHQVGTLPDGRPFLAMKLVHGQSLDRLLGEQGPGAGRWLAVFERVCEAVGYAHAQGVIHRDLKPANVMVGDFGEVQVMDWGLAKVLGQAAPAADPEATTPPAFAADDNRTEAGSVMGTPAYMAPEQAIGAVDRLDRRSDVFGLGAILCALLTGLPPYARADAEEVRRLAARAKLDDAFARLDGCGAEPGLVALCKRCLAAEPEQRPSDGAELAAAVAGLRRAAEERARQAELEQARAEVQAAEQAKRRRLRRAAGTLLVLLSAGIAAATLGMWRAERARGEVEKQHQTAETARLREAAQRQAAETARNQARTGYVLALRTVDEVVVGLLGVMAKQPASRAWCEELLGIAREGLRKLLAGVKSHGPPDSTQVWTHFRLGEVELALGRTEAAWQEYQLGHGLAQRLADADPNDARARRDLAFSHNKMGDLALQIGRTEEALGWYRRSLEVRDRLATDTEDVQDRLDLFFSCLKLGSAERSRHEYARACAWFVQGREVLRPLSEKNLLVGQAKEYPALVEREIALCQSAEQAIARPLFAFAQRAVPVSELLSLRARALLYRGRVGDAIKTAECWRDWAERHETDRDGQRYEAARAFALCAAADAGRRDALVRQAVAVLTKLRQAGYFKDAKRLAHFETDTDFAGVRGHPAFAAFAKSLKE